MVSGVAKDRLHALWCHRVVRGPVGSPGLMALVYAGYATQKRTGFPEKRDYCITIVGAEVARRLFNQGRQA